MYKQKGILALIAFVLLIGTSIQETNAQYFSVGDKVVSAGIGLGSTLYTGSGYKVGIPPIAITGEYGFKDDIGPGVIGIGGILGYNTTKYEYGWTGYSYSWKYTSIIIGARGTYHMELVDELDTYGGIGLYFNSVSSKYTGDNTYVGNYSAVGSKLGFSIFAGARYYFKDNLAVFGELGYSIAYLTLGVSMKLE